MNIDDGVTHLAFADEAYRNQARYRSVACVSMPVGLYKANSEAIRASRTIDRELKWSKINGHDRLRDIEAVFAHVVELSVRKEIRVDVLRWDTADSRHDIRHRDDDANQNNMYRMLFCDVFGKRWGGSEQHWALFVDEQGLRSPEFMEMDLQFNRNLQATVREILSDHELFVQVADIFAGIGAFSWRKYEEFQIWQQQPRQTGQMTLLGAGFSPPADCSTGVDKYRFQLLQTVNNLFKNNKMYVSLKSGHGFQTMRLDLAHCNINFWPYKPQGEYDKAPTKLR